MNIREVLKRPGLERLAEWYETGPAQRAAVESFVDEIEAHVNTYGVAAAITDEQKRYIKLCETLLDKGASDDWNSAVLWCIDLIRGKV